jgi:hypothetical protein
MSDDDDHDPSHIQAALRDFAAASGPVALKLGAQMLLIIRLPCGCIGHITTARPVQDFALKWLENYEAELIERDHRCH